MLHFNNFIRDYYHQSMQRSFYVIWVLLWAISIKISYPWKEKTATEEGKK